MLQGSGLVGINDAVIHTVFCCLGGEVRVRLPPGSLGNFGLREGRLALLQLPDAAVEEALFDETEVDPPWVWAIFASRQFRAS
jgi:hypothetical protein